MFIKSTVLSFSLNYYIHFVACISPVTLNAITFQQANLVTLFKSQRLREIRNFINNISVREIQAHFTKPNEELDELDGIKQLRIFQHLNRCKQGHKV